MKQLLCKILGVFAVVSAISCGGGGGGGGGGNNLPGAGLAQISVISDFQPATRTVPGYADSLRVTIVPPEGVVIPGDIPNPFILNRSNKNRVLNNLAPNAQPYVLNMEALTNDNVVGTATRSIVAEENRIREVDVSANLDSQIASIAIDGVASINAGQNTTFTAFAKNSGGATLFSGTGFTWTSSGNNVMAVNQDSGNANATALGNVTIPATLKGSVLSGSKQVVVNSSGGVGITIFPTSAAVTTGGTKQFGATVTGAGNTGVAWSITPVGQAGGVSGTGLYTASNNEGLYYVTATSLADPTAKAEAIVSVAAPGSQHRLIYQSNFDNNLNIWMTNLTCTQFERLTDNMFEEIFPILSPDGTKIAFCRDSGGGFELWTKVLGTGVETKVTTSTQLNPFSVNSPTWTSNGQQLLFDVGIAGDTQIWRVDADGTDLIQLINSPTGIDRFPSIHGNKLVFYSSRTPQGDWYMANTDGSNAVPLGSNVSSSRAAAGWTPDGSKFVVADDQHFNVYNAGTLVRTDNVTLNMIIDGAAITPDGQSVFFSASDGQNTQIFVLRLSDKVVTRISDRAGGLAKITLGTLN